MTLPHGGQDVTTFQGDERAQAVYYFRLYGRHLANCVRRVDLAKPCTCGYHAALKKIRGVEVEDAGPMF